MKNGITEVVTLDIEGGVATVTLNRPERRNGVTVDLCLALYATLETVAASDARVLILRGAGDHFCVGADLGDGNAQDGPPSRSPDEQTRIYHAASLLHTMPQITIAAIDGGCAGAGMGWAMACDLRFASDRARFATAFLNVGASGDMGLAWSLTRLVGSAKTCELMLLPEKFGAARAFEIGLLTGVMPAADFYGEVLDKARSLAARDGALLAAMKANLVEAAALPIAAYIDRETGRHLAIVGAPGFADRMRKAFRTSRLGK